MRSAAALVLLALAGYALLLAVFEAPAFGDAQVPARNVVIERYIQRGREETGSPNLVNAILFDYRGYDTLGEATVLFVSVAAAAAVLVGGTGAWVLQRVADTESPVLRTVSRLVIPVVQVFGIYVITHGHISPGGGFAGGTVLGASFALYLFVFGPRRAHSKIPGALGEVLEGAAALWYILVGLGGVLLGTAFLTNAAAGFPLGTPGNLLSAGALWLIGLGIGAKVAVTVANIFLHLVGEE